MFFLEFLQPVPPSPVAARKISFNGLKETIVLPQQAGNSLELLFLLLLFLFLLRLAAWGFRYSSERCNII